MPQYDLTLRDYWQIIQKRRLVVIVIFITVLISSIIYTNMQPPVYQAVALVQYIEKRPLATMLTELIRSSSGDPLTTQSRIITSIPILEKVVVELGWVDKDANAAKITAQAGVLRQFVSTDIIRETDIIRIVINHGNPQRAADIANKITEVYIKENQREKSKQTRNVREFIEKNLEKTTAKLNSLEEALVKFKEIEVPSGVGLPLENRLADLEAKRQNLLQQYTPLHPDIKNIEEQIEEVKKQLKALPKKELEYNRLNREIEITARIFRTFKDKLEGARISEAENIADASLVDRAAPAVSPIRPNKPFNYFLGAVIGLMLGLSGTFVVEHLDSSIGTIDEVETFLKLPALGVIPYLRTKDEKPRPFIHKIKPREYKGDEKISHLRKRLLIHYLSSSPTFEAYRILRTNIQTEVFKEDMQGKIILFSSAGPEEGKSITISNLAIVMAQAGLRTLLIDADMRRSVIHKIFGLKTKEPGLCDVLRGTVKPKEAIRTFTDILIGSIGIDEIIKIPGLDNLSILTAGSLPATPAELLGSPEMAKLLGTFKDTFAVILLDSPPVLAVTDAVVLAPKTDGVILVYKVGKTARSILARAKTQLVESGAQVKGIILNNISPAMEMRYGYYYHYKYYGKYYGEKKEET